MSAPLFGAVEAGGTKFLCAVGTSPQDLRDIFRLPTESPGKTLGEVAAYFSGMAVKHGPLAAVGIASFGPAGVDPASAHWGHILSTPKPSWSHTDVAGMIARSLNVPIGFDTDVNGAILAEHRWGAARGLDVATYVTVGTGIGGGTIVGGRVVHGLVHPEVAHFYPPRHRADHVFAGVCPFHGGCLEGLACGPAIIARWGGSLSELPSDHEAHEIVAFYLAHLSVALQAILSPQRIVFGGGVADAPGLRDHVREKYLELGAGYFGDRATLKDVIAAPQLGNRSGLLGALRLAELALIQQNKN